MGRKALTRVSQREYAKLLDISNEAVSRAVKDGRIKKGWDNKEQKIIVEHADIEFGFLHKQTNVSQLLQNPGEDAPANSNQSLTLTGGSSYGEAKRVKEILQAQLVALDLKERKGELVQKDEVYKQLYAYGQQMRVTIQAIPDRTIDNILASKSRAEAHNILATAIQEALEDLTTHKLEFTPRQ